MVQLMPLNPPNPIISCLIYIETFWYRLIPRLSWEKRPLNECGGSSSSSSCCCCCRAPPLQVTRVATRCGGRTGCRSRRTTVTTTGARQLRGADEERVLVQSVLGGQRQRRQSRLQLGQSARRRCTADCTHVAPLPLVMNAEECSEPMTRSQHTTS